MWVSELDRKKRRGRQGDKCGKRSNVEKERE